MDKPITLWSCHQSERRDSQPGRLRDGFFIDPTLQKKKLLTGPGVRIKTRDVAVLQTHQTQFRLKDRF